jgi:hypothetical protein
VSSLSLFPAYRAVQESVEAERVHPADLWAVDWRWREVANDPDVVPRQADASVRAEFEGHLLALMRGTQSLTAAAKMSEICAGLGAGSMHPQVRTFWNLAAAMFEAQHHGLVGFDVFTKRVASRLLAQLRLLQRGDSDVSERLARDTLFFCSQAAPAGPGIRVPRLTAAREAYGFGDEAPTDYSHSVLGRFDPAIVAHAKKRVAAAKEAWSATAGGEMHRLGGLSEQFALVGDSLRRLFPFGESFAAELQGAVQQTQAAQAAPPAPLAMEVATSLLYLEAALDDGDFDQPEHADRVKRLGERLSLVRQKQPPQPLEPWMEELYRRVSDRQTMGSVVQELRASLSEVEKAIDKFFRNPADQSALHEVPIQLGSMRGVLSVLGMDAASQALVRMRDEVDGLVSTEVDPERIKSAGVFERLAGNLSALGFMIDMLSVQPQMAKSLFVYDAEAGTLAPVMGRSAAAEAGAGCAPVEPRLLEQAQMLAFTSVREDVPVEDVTRDLERLSHEAQAADQPALAGGDAQGAGRLQQGARSGRPRQRSRRAFRGARRFRRDVDRADGLRAGQRAGAARADGADHADRGLRARRRDARGLPRGSARGRRIGARRVQRAALDAGRPRAADDAQARLPYPEGQLANGRAEVVRRGRVGVRAGLQHPARRAAGRRAAADRVRRMGARLPRRMGRGHRGAPLGQPQRARGPAGGEPPRRRRVAEPASDISLPIGLPADLPSRADLDLGAPASTRRARERRARRLVRARPVELRPQHRARRGRAGAGDGGDAGGRVGDVRPLRRCAQRGDGDDAQQRRVRPRSVGSGRPRSRRRRGAGPDPEPRAERRRARRRQRLGLRLDLSTGEAVGADAPADFASSGLVDLEVGGDPIRAGRRATSTSRSSARCGSASRSSTST